MKNHFVMLARYNSWANRRVYDAAATAPAEALDQDVGACAGSIIATLNHLLLVDRNWMAQLNDGGEAPDSVDDVLIDDLAELRAVREVEDARILSFAERLTEGELDKTVRYHTIRQPLVEELPLSTVLTYSFTHQIHHRGELWAGLTRIGATVTPYDLLCFHRETNPSRLARVA
ncbi:DinB family protein [Blastochloris sulfoviridis]|uniref:Damage-inducible protein DinB n=1 Tax=Blastochloris sulfoviridis TaxID=50712 RepID=A0A5M6HVF3_9HYPH|nr:DinB family protein [Blastochloris sulfoviridis]KAA5599618.1 damage-inducible protein DinB [Blastochloris sulfoviridis]